MISVVSESPTNELVTEPDCGERIDTDVIMDLRAELDRLKKEQPDLIVSARGNNEM